MAMNSTLISYCKYPILQLDVHDVTKPVDIFILCQHGFRSSSFTNFFPRFLPPYDKDLSQELFVKYLEIEHDFGSRELSLFIFDGLKSKMNAAIITVNCDRGIVDANRQDDYCVRPLIKTYISAENLSELLGLNYFVRSEIFSLLQHLSSDGYILDVHSMWPYSLNVNPDRYLNFADFVQLYELPENLSEKRRVNLIVNDINGVSISNQTMASSVEKALIEGGYDVVRDEPYYMLPERSNYFYFSHFNGVAIDIPRNLLGDSRKNSFPDFSFMKISQEKLRNFGDSIVSGITMLKSSSSH